MRPATPDEHELYVHADAVRARAYAPYSSFTVGALLVAEDGSHHEGANVENASFGTTICAERSAIVGAVTAGHRRFTTVAVAGPASTVAPCGACRQVLREFGDPERLVVVMRHEGEVRAFTLAELLPLSFGPSGPRPMTDDAAPAHDKPPGDSPPGDESPSDQLRATRRRTACRRATGRRSRRPGSARGCSRSPVGRTSASRRSSTPSAAPTSPSSPTSRRRPGGASRASPTATATSSSCSTCRASSDPATRSRSACSAPSTSRSRMSMRPCSCSTARRRRGPATASSPTAWAGSGCPSSSC